MRSPGDAGAEGPTALVSVVEAPAPRLVLRVLTLVLLVLLVWTAAFGADSTFGNPAPRLVHTVLWVGLLLGSLLLGPVWRVANPLRLLSAGLARGGVGVTGRAPADSVLARLGYLPAAVMLFAFVWTDQAVDPSPRALLVLVGAYAVVQLAAAAWLGSGWYEHGDAFESCSELLGRLAPLARDAHGRLRLRDPRQGLATTPVWRGLRSLLAVLVGARVFAALAVTPVWRGVEEAALPGPAWMPASLHTTALVACIALVHGLMVLATRAGAFLVPALIPVVAAYLVATYLVPVLTEGRIVLVQLSDPLGRGWDLLGGLVPQRLAEPVVPEAIATAVALGAFAGGHLLALLAAEDVVSARYARDQAGAVQLPFRLVLAVSALGGVVLLSGT